MDKKVKNKFDLDKEIKNKIKLKQTMLVVFEFFLITTVIVFGLNVIYLSPPVLTYVEAKEVPVVSYESTQFNTKLILVNGLEIPIKNMKSITNLNGIPESVLIYENKFGQIGIVDKYMYYKIKKNDDICSSGEVIVDKNSSDYKNYYIEG